jgi:hypothetical protein
MKINIKVPVAPVARQKKSPEIAKNIIQSVNSETNEVVSIKVIPNTFNGINNNIPVTSCYIDADGDLVKISKFEGRTLVEIEMCDKSLKEIEELCNINDSDDKKSSTGITRTRIKINTTDIDVCKTTLGLYRNYILNKAQFDALNVKCVRFTYELNGKIIYESIIKCPAENKEAVIKLIKDLKKEVIEWY